MIKLTVEFKDIDEAIDVLAGSCPRYFGLEEIDCRVDGTDCEDCWTKALKKYQEEQDDSTT